MGKVVTSQGLTEFVQSGKFTNVPDHKAASNGAPALEVKPEVPVKDIGGEKPDEKKAEPDAKAAEVADEGLDEADKDLPERIRKIIGKKHRAMKEAQEANEEAERFAETQYNERKLAESRATAAELKAKELEAKSAPAKPAEPELVAPNVADFKDAAGQVDWDKYTDAKAEFAAKKAVNEERARQAEETATKERLDAEKLVKTRMEAVRKAHPDFDTVLESIKGSEADQVPQHVLNYLFESEQGGELHYYLMKHPEETIRIKRLKPILALAELGKLEATLSPAKPDTPVSPPKEAPRGGAPAPITPLSGEGTAGINTDPSKMSYKELRAYERGRRMNKH